MTNIISGEFDAIRAMQVDPWHCKVLAQFVRVVFSWFIYVAVVYRCFVLLFYSRHIELFNGLYKPTNAELGAHPKWCCLCMVFVSFLETIKPLNYIVTHVWDVF